MCAPTTRQALLIAESMLGRCPDHVSVFHPVVGGDDSYNFQLRVHNVRTLLKIKRKPGSPVGIYFHDRIRKAGVPVPELVAFDPHAGPNGETCVIWEWIEGQSAHWESGEPCPYNEAEFGEYLRHIHDLRFEGPFGLLGDDPPCTSHLYPDLGPTSESWMEFFHFDRAAQRYFDKGYFDRREADLIAMLPERMAGVLNGVEPHLLHMGDIMHHGNMILNRDNGRILAVVDYVESMAGDPRWELAWVDYYFSQYPFERMSFDMERFRFGYGATHETDDAVGRFYLVAILLFEKLLFFKPDSPRGRWAIEKVRNNLARTD
jgi:hypothetical protein